MITGSNTLVKVRRRTVPNLPRVDTAPPMASGETGVVAQIFLAKLSAMEQRLNSLVATRPASIQPSAVPAPGNFPEHFEEVKSSKLRDLFD